MGGQNGRILGTGFPNVLDDLVLQFLQPVFKQNQNLRVGYGFKLFGMGHFLHQALTHMGWIDTFVHAFGQSEMDQAGYLIGIALIQQAH